MNIGKPLVRLVRVYAKLYGMSISEFCRLAIIHYIKNHTDRPGAESLTIKE